MELDTTQSPLTIDVLVGTGNVTKTGSNDLTIQDAGGLAGILHVAAGKLATTEALYRQTPTGLHNWYDASSTNNFTFESDGRINRWKSRVNTPRTDAQRYSDDLAWSPVLTVWAQRQTGRGHGCLERSTPPASGG